MFENNHCLVSDCISDLKKKFLGQHAPRPPSLYPRYTCVLHTHAWHCGSAQWTSSPPPTETLWSPAENSLKKETLLDHILARHYHQLHLAQESLLESSKLMVMISDLHLDILSKFKGIFHHSAITDIIFFLLNSKGVGLHVLVSLHIQCS